MASAILVLWVASPLLFGLWSGLIFKTKQATEEDIIRLLAARAFGLFCLRGWCSTFAAGLFLMWANEHNWAACGSTSEPNSCGGGALVLFGASPLVTLFIGFCLWVWASHCVLHEVGEHVSTAQMSARLRKVALGWSAAYWLAVLGFVWLTFH